MQDHILTGGTHLVKNVADTLNLPDNVESVLTLQYNTIHNDNLTQQINNNVTIF